MTYSKPEVVKLNSALSAIRGTSSSKGESTTDTVGPPMHNATIGAYESDE
jgi:hypothetical protein